MENNGKNEGKKKTNQKIGVGGLIGLGGVLVIGGLLMVANFAIKRRRSKTRSSDKNITTTDTKASQEASNKGTCVEKKNEDQGCLLPTSSPLMALGSSSCESHVVEDGDGSSTTSDVSQEVRLATEIDGLRVSEMVLPDSQEQEIIKLRDDFGALEDEMCGTEKQIPIETTEEVENNEETSAVVPGSEMHSGEDKEDEENSVENEKAGSDDTRDSSLESNTEAIWPGEMIEETMPELEEASRPETYSEEGKAIQTEMHKQSHNDARTKNMTIDEQISEFWVPILSLWVLVLFFLWIYPVPCKALSAVLSLFS